jgi:AbrB family looped-hinge helix DNA binding protein
MAEETRTVGERGQVTLPKRLRERLGIRGGDEVVVREAEDGRIVVEKAVTEADLAEGYRARSEEARELAAELDGVSAEADDELGDAPSWKS